MTAVMEEARPVAIRDDDDRFYLYPGTGELLDRVSTIIEGTDSKPYIAKWHGTTTAAYCVDHLPLVAATAKVLGRKAAIDLSKDEAGRIRDLKADAGTYVHDVQEALILWAASRDGEGSNISIPLLPAHLADAWYDYGGGQGAPLAEVVEYMVDGFINFVTAFNPTFHAAEMPVYNQPLGYAGTLDMIIALDGYAISVGTGPHGEDEVIACPGSVLMICVDTKTGKAMKGTWKEQLTAYRRAPECDPSRMGDLRPMPPTQAGAVLHLRPDYPDGFSLTLVSSADDEAAWERFSAAAFIYRDRQQVKDRPGPAIRALRPDGTMPGVRLCDVNGEGYGRALNPLRKALGATAELADVAEFSAVDLLEVKGVGPKLIDVIRRMLADHRLTLKGEESVSGPRDDRAGGRVMPINGILDLQRRDAPLGEIRIGHLRGGAGQGLPQAGAAGDVPLHYRERVQRHAVAEHFGGKVDPVGAPQGPLGGHHRPHGARRVGAARASWRSTRTWSCGTAGSACGTATASWSRSRGSRACAPALPNPDDPASVQRGPRMSGSSSPSSSIRRRASRSPASTSRSRSCPA